MGNYGEEADYCYISTLYYYDDGVWRRWEKGSGEAEIEPTFKVENLPLKQWLQDIYFHGDTAVVSNTRILGPKQTISKEIVFTML